MSSIHLLKTALAAVVAASIGFGSPALAGVGGPPIAYVKGAPTGDVIYLVYPDGTGLTKLYQAATTTRNGGKIDRLTLIPGGGAVAFTQDNVLLRVQKYTENGQPNGQVYNVTVPNDRCVLGDVDYRSDGTLIVSDGCLNVWTVAPSATTATLLFRTSENIAAVRWMLNGSVLFHEGQLDSMKLKRWSSGVITTIAATTYFPPFLGMSRIANEATISDRYTYKTVDLSTGSSKDGCKPAGNVRPSPDSRNMIYRSSKGYLFVQKIDCSGAPFRLANAVRDALDWRAN